MKISFNAPREEDFYAHSDKKKRSRHTGFGQQEGAGIRGSFCAAIRYRKRLQVRKFSRGKATNHHFAQPGGEKIILLGTGKEEELDVKSVRELAAPLYKALTAEGVKEATIATPSVTNSSSNDSLAAKLADALQIESYEFKKYKTAKEGKDAPPKLEGIEIFASNPAQARKL